MLDENLPTFQFKQQPEKPLSCPVYFTRNGSEPAAEYVFERAHPSTTPAAANKYAVALKDPYAQDVVYAEVVVSPEWQQPTLSAAEIRATGQGQNSSSSNSPAPAPVIPDTFTIQLYDPDQSVVVRYIPGSLTRTESWEFEMLSQSFKMPTPSQLDRQGGNQAGGIADFRPRNMFKWKREGRLTKDMTCYNVGKSLGKHKSKEPDITIALFKMGRETAVTVYEPNLRRVEMEDRKGLDIVLVLGAEVIRDLYLAPEKRPDLFNTGTVVPSPPLPSGAFGRAPTNGTPVAMSGAIGSAPPLASTSTANVASSSSSSTKPNGSGIDPETLRLMKQMKKEDDEQLKRQARERQRREAEERRHVEEMLKQEENENRRRQAEVDRETERLRQLYGVQGQDLLPTGGRPLPGARQNSDPPRQQSYGPPQQHHPTFAPPPQQPQRPTSVGPG
ncbi:hypothetical protein M406DRAFT_219713, partial [Cryphonectria parasitica EP155]